MPQVTNQSAKLLQFKPLSSGAPRFELVPGQTMDVDGKQLDDLASRDKVFLAYYADRAVTVEGWSPDDVKQADKMKAEYVNPHRPAPDFSGHKTGDLMPEDEPQKTVEPIEPTPMAGVPGNARQAKKIIAAERDVSRLNAYLESETRDTIKKALVKRIDELETVDDGDE